MGSTTTNYGIPYPLNTDFVTDGAQNMQDIAEKVDDILVAQVANRNLFYNGAMQVTQRYSTAVTGITSGTASYHTADRWLTNLQALGTWTQSIETDVPTGQGFRNSLKMLCTTADASPAAADLLMIQQRLEGFDLQSIKKGTANAQPLTLSFWVKSNKIGTYVFELYDNNNTRHCCKTYTINVSGTWEYKTITFPADTTGALTNDNNMSFLCAFILGAGSNRTTGTLATTWAAYNAVNEAVGQVNLADTLNNYWQVTGVQLTVGDTDFPFQFKNYAQELRECQRYYEKSYNTNVIAGTNTDAGIVGNGHPAGSFDPQYIARFVVTKRGLPTVVCYAPNGTINSLEILGVSANSAATIDKIGFGSFRGRYAVVVSSYGVFFHFTADAEL